MELVASNHGSLRSPQLALNNIINIPQLFLPGLSSSVRNSSKTVKWPQHLGTLAMHETE